MSFRNVSDQGINFTSDLFLSRASPLYTYSPTFYENGSTGTSAKMLTLVREVIQLINLILGTPGATPQDPPIWVSSLIRYLCNVYKLAREKTGESQLCQEENYDLRLFEKSYNAGDVVYLRDSSTRIVSVPKCGIHEQAHMS